MNEIVTELDEEAQKKIRNLILIFLSFVVCLLLIQETIKRNI